MSGCRVNLRELERKNTMVMDCDCDPNKFTGVLKCPHGNVFTGWTRERIEAWVKRIADKLDGKKK
jgi:hypothetical protein